MKELLNSIILYELVFLFWMTLTLANRLMDFTGNSPLLPNLEQLFFEEK